MKAQIYLTADAYNSADRLCELIESNERSVVSKETMRTTNNETIILLETEQVQDEIEFCEFWNFIESRRWKKTFELQIRVLKTYRAEFLERIDEIINSFRVK